MKSHLLSNASAWNSGIFSSAWYVGKGILCTRTGMACQDKSLSLMWMESCFNSMPGMLGNAKDK
jgi:hypothetical protein